MRLLGASASDLLRGRPRRGVGLPGLNGGGGMVHESVTEKLLKIRPYIMYI